LADHRHGAVAHRLAKPVDQGDEGPAVLGAFHRNHVVDVGAADEGLAAGAGEDHDPHIVLARDRMEGLDQVGQRRRPENVQPTGIVVHDARHHAGRTAFSHDVDLMRGSRHDVSLRGSFWESNFAY